VALEAKYILFTNEKKKVVGLFTPRKELIILEAIIPVISRATTCGAFRGKEAEEKLEHFWHSISPKKVDSERAIGKLNCLKSGPAKVAYRNGACIAQIEHLSERGGDNHARIKYPCRCLIKVPIDTRTLIEEARIIAAEFYHARNEVVVVHGLRN
jgi:hypothetical protein